MQLETSHFLAKSVSLPSLYDYTLNQTSACIQGENVASSNHIHLQVMCSMYVYVTVDV
jgi:hypothetical protein